MNLNRRTATIMFIAVAVASISSHSIAQQAPPAPFGLKWLGTTDEIRSLGVTLTPMDGGDYGVSFTATGLPKALSDLRTAILSFGYDDHLYRIVAISREFPNDYFGSSARARYDELAASLAKTYTPGEIYEQRPTESYYDEPDKFAYALSESKAFWFRMFSSPEASIELSIGSSHYDTYWRLIYTNTAGQQQFEAGKGARELDAL